MRSLWPVKLAKSGYILLSLLLCVLGVVLIACPLFSAKLLCYILGGLLMVYGAIKIVGYFSKDLYRLAFQFDFAFGMLLCLVGLLMILFPEGALTVIYTVIGIIVLADGLFKIQTAFEAKKFGINKWWAILLFAVASALLGLLLVLNPVKTAGFIMVLLGVSLILEGILNFLVALLTVRIMKNQIPDGFDFEDEQ